MDIAVLTWNERSRQLCELFQQYSEYKVRYIMETDFSLWGSVMLESGQELPVLSAGSVIRAYREGKIKKFIIPSLDEGTNDIYRDLMEFYEIPEEDFLYAPTEIFCNPSLSAQEKIAQICRFSRHRELETLEIHIADNCNLKCKNCTMMAGLVEKNTFSDFDETMEGIRKLKTFFEHVKIFRILGGEPVLNPELPKYVEEVRKIFPYADMRLATNGLLLLNENKALLECLRKNDVTLYISYYELPVNHIEEIHMLLDKWKIKHYITKTVTAFQKVYNLKGDSEKNFSFESCVWRKNGCETLKGHDLSVCFVPGVIQYLGEKFQIDIPKDGKLDLFTPGLTTEKIRKFLKTPFETCRYCALRGHLDTWKQLEPQEKDRISSWSI